MSLFSGKCDLYDGISILGGFQKFKERYPVIHIGEDIVIKYEKPADLIRYYPHIIAVSCGDYVRISSKSWVDIEEERYGHMPIHDYYRDKLREEFALAKKLGDDYEFPEER